MAVTDDDVFYESLQGLFSDPLALKRFLEMLLNRFMQAECAEHVNAGRYERGDDRRGHRNGYKGRRFNTRVGQLKLSVPQSRNCQPYHPSMFSHYQRSERALLCACVEMYFQGVSTRKVNEVINEMCGMNISSAAVSRIAQELDEKLQEFGGRKLNSTEYPFLMIDARYEKVRVEGKIISQAVLVGVGIDTTGRREILDWRVGDSESEETWGQMFKNLKDRGLKGLKMVISDAHSGITSAMKRHFQGVSWQRCSVHFKRELLNKLPLKHRKEFAAEIRGVYQCDNKKEAMVLALELAAKWSKKYPSVGRMLEEKTEDTLSFYDFPEEYRTKLYSTNMVENIMKQLRQRTHAVQIFANRRSCWRLAGAQLIEIHEQWLGAKTAYLPGLERYLIEET